MSWNQHLCLESHGCFAVDSPCDTVRSLHFIEPHPIVFKGQVQTLIVSKITCPSNALCLPSSSKCSRYLAFNTSKFCRCPCERPLACGEKSLSEWKHFINGIKRRNELEDPSDLIFHGELNVGDVQFSVFFNLLFPAPAEISMIIYCNEIQSHRQA